MVDLQLVNYIKRHLAKGYTKQEIEKILLENNWEKKEAKEAFKIIENKKISKPTQKLFTKPKEEKQQMAITNHNQITTLKNFIISIRARGVKDEEIKNALLTKKWPVDLIGIAFSELKPIKGDKPSSTSFVKPKFQKKQKKPFNFKRLLQYILGFIVLATVLAGTVFVYQYVSGLASYEVTINGVIETGKCTKLDCSDMKEYAFNFASENMILYFGISAALALLITGLYSIQKIRNGVLWGTNLLYFFFLVFIGYTWLNFTGTI
jgi:hypothetical protein